MSPKRLAIALSPLYSLFFPRLVSAQEPVNIVVPGPYTALNNLRPSMYSVTIINILFGLAGVLAFIYLLWGGVQWITAGGEKDSVDKGRRKIIQALVGLAIVFSAYAIIYILRVLFQVNAIQLNFAQLGT